MEKCACELDRSGQCRQCLRYHCYQRGKRHCVLRHVHCHTCPGPKNPHEAITWERARNAVLDMRWCRGQCEPLKYSSEACYKRLQRNRKGMGWCICACHIPIDAIDREKFSK